MSASRRFSANSVTSSFSTCAVDPGACSRASHQSAPLQMSFSASESLYRYSFTTLIISPSPLSWWISCRKAYYSLCPEHSSNVRQMKRKKKRWAGACLRHGAHTGLKHFTLSIGQRSGLHQVALALHPGVKDVLQVENCQSYTINDTRCDDTGPRSLSWDRKHPYPNMAVLSCNAARTLLREHTPTCEGTPFIAPASWPSRRPSRATNTALSACRSRSWPPVCHQQVSLPQRDTSLIAWWLCRPRGEAARLPSVCPVGCHPCRNGKHGQATL